MGSGVVDMSTVVTPADEAPHPVLSAKELDTVYKDLLLMVVMWIMLTHDKIKFDKREMLDDMRGLMEVAQAQIAYEAGMSPTPPEDEVS